MVKDLRLRFAPLLARGAIAQLGERLTGSQKVGGSIPPSSTSLPLSDLLKIDLTRSFEMGFKLMRELLQQNKERYKVDHLSRYHIAIDSNLIGSDSFR